MNAIHNQHFTEEAWEKYTLERLSEEDAKPMEEHLLLCPSCQDLLAELDEYIELIKAATSKTHRRLSKKVRAAAALAGSIALLP